MADAVQLVLLVAVVVAVVAWLGTRPLLMWQYRHLPGPPRLPFLGSALDIVRSDFTYFIHACGKKYGPVFKVWVGGTPWVYINDVTLAARLLQCCPVRPTSVNAARLFPDDINNDIANNIIILTGAPWRLARRAFEVSVMHPHGLVSHMPTMRNAASALVGSLEPAAASGSPVDIWEAVGNMTMQVTVAAAFGVDTGGAGKAGGGEGAEKSGGDVTTTGRHMGSELVSASRTYFNLLSVGGASAWMRMGMLLPQAHSILKALANALPDAGHTTAVAARRKISAIGVELAQGWKAAHETEAAGPLLETGFMQQLLEGRARGSGEQLTLEQTLAQPAVFILAGYETTAAMIAFAVYELCRSPGAEAKVVAEVDAAVSRASERGDGGALSIDDLCYTKAVLQETLRTQTPVPLYTRIAPPAGLTLGDWRLPGGAVLWVPAYNFHHDPALFEAPDEFRPERFLPEGSDHARGYLPFGGGSRMCVGYRFALQEGVLALAALYAQYTFRLSPGQEPLQIKTSVARNPVNGIMVTVHKRPEPAGGGVVSASFLNAKPAVGGIGVEPRRGGVLRVLFTVASDAVADTVVRSRRNLRDVDPSAAVFDVLSDREEAQHQALWPAFLAAKVAGKRAQFHRARLVVDGERPGADQQAHMTKVIEALCQVEDEDEDEDERVSQLDDYQPDDARDECVRPLIKLGADIFNPILRHTVIARIVREVFAMARVPQLLNEAVLGVALAREQDKLHGP
ncbi:hypothetical protein FOA52_000070 [Chlamydomonas sp. UWO 241]|nr:hypothetical protein FOA52_000070 [Chlamydomonas sp. UWO 241]